MWTAFAVIVVTLLLLDLGVFRREQRAIGVKESLYYSAGYIAVGLLYGVGVFFWVGEKQGEDYLTGYVLEKCLSLDNIFVISMLFKHFSIPLHLQHRVLLYGIAGVLLLRGLMIGVGAALVHEFHWILYFFGVFLMVTGLRMLFVEEKEKLPEENKVLHLLRRYMAITPELHGSRFFIKVEEAGKLITKATPLFVALVCVEFADVVFALDSVPAIFAITSDTFVVFTSNVFAILGLRALYFALAAMLQQFSRLKHGISLVLIFIGFKIFSPLVGLPISSVTSLLVTLALLAGGVVASLYDRKKG